MSSSHTCTMNYTITPPQKKYLNSIYSFQIWPWFFFVNVRIKGSLKPDRSLYAFQSLTYQSLTVITSYFVQNWKVSNYTEDTITVILEQISTSVTIKNHILTLLTDSFKVSLTHISCCSCSGYHHQCMRQSHIYDTSHTFIKENNSVFKNLLIYNIKLYFIHYKHISFFSIGVSM